MIGDSGIAFSNGIVVHWNEVASIHAYKVDAVEKDIAFLEFSLENGEVVEICNLESEFAEFETHARRFLELPLDWPERLQKSSSQTDPIVIWRKEPR